MPVATAVRAHTTQDVATLVKDAAANRAPLRIVGRGHWLDAGRPVHTATPLALDALSGIIAYIPGDLTLTARAGTTLAEIASATAEHGQWLALDPFGPDDGTIGATVATASAGPLAHSLGTPRDAVLGLEVVTGDGTIIRTGGRVVKNVAGFDLTRLFTGSWGTLGVITEVTVRLRAKPE
ncbi:MAG: FAD-binding oxidoreductase, partial [Gemmatimonadaceae bacterium]